MNGKIEPYTVINYVIEVRSKRYPHWMTWTPPIINGQEPPNDEAAIKLYLEQLRTRHDPAKMQFRLVYRTAFIVDQVMAEELPDGSLSGIEEYHP